MPRPKKRFVIRRLPIGSPTKLPWCVSDATRPHYVGRFATWSEARNASVGAPVYGNLLAAVVANVFSHDFDLPARFPR